MKPTLYAARAIPVGSLEWQDFQTFVCACLEKIGPRHGFRFDSVTGASGDGGFDAHARRLSDSASVCIQCKRNESRNLTLSLVGPELAKVAMRAWLEKSHVKEHYFVCSGGVSDDVRSAQREVGRAKLIAHALSGAGDDDLKGLKDDVAAQQGAPDEIIRAYVVGLDKIVVWSGVDLDVQLSVCFSELADVVHRFFHVHVALREHPRPDFDEAAYLAKLEAPPPFAIAELFVVSDQLPPGFRRSSAADARRGSSSAVVTDDKGARDAVAALERVPRGLAAVLCGEGGAGKSTLLSTATRSLAGRRRLDSGAPLPILLELRGYRGSLDDVIHRALGVRFGNWRSMPGAFALFLDGINEVDPALLPALSSELEPLDWPRVGLVISARPTGLATPLVLGRIGATLRVLPPDALGVRSLAESVLPRDRVTAFVDALKPRLLAHGGQLFELPFGILMAAEVFGREGTVPESAGTLVETHIEARRRRNDETARTVLGALADVPLSAVRLLASRFAFKMLIEERKRQTSGDAALRLLGDELTKLRASGAVGVDLTAATAQRVLVHYELLGVSSSGDVMLPHDVVAGWLASVPLAEDWRGSLASLQTKLADDAWSFCASRVPAVEHEAFISEVLLADIVLAARCAITMSAPAVSLVEQRAVAQLAEGGLGRRMAARALGILATPSAIRELATRLPANRDDDIMEFHDLAGALLIAGHRPTLERVLEGADRMSSMPGLKASGGEVSLWTVAPASLAVVAARDRIDSGESRIVTSLHTIAAYGDLSDVPRLLKIVDTAGEISVAGRALDTLSHVDADAARQRASAMWVKATDDVRGLFAPLHVALTGAPDIDWAVRCVCANELPGVALEQQVRESALKMLQGPLEATVIDRLRDAFVNRSGANAPWLWSVMNAHPNVEATAVASAAMNTSGESEFGWACNYASATPRDDATHARFRQELRDRFGREPSILTTWGGARLVDYLLETGANVEAARYLAEGLEIIGDNIADENYDHRFRRDEIVRQAARIPEHIALDTIQRLLLGGDLIGIGQNREARTKLAARLDAGRLERMLEKAVDARERAELLAAMVDVEPTERMRRFLRETLAAVVPFDHISLAALRHPIRAWWSDETLSAVVDALVGADFRQSDERHLIAEIVDDVGGLLTRAQYERCVEPKLADGLPRIVKDAFVWWKEIVTLIRADE